MLHGTEITGIGNVELANSLDLISVYCHSFKVEVWKSLGLRV